MMERLFLLCLLHLFFNFTVQQKAYLITAPKLLRLDASENVLVQLFGYDQETTVNLYLKQTLASGSKVYASQSVELNANNNYQALATLRIIPTDFSEEQNHVYLQAISSGFTAHEKIPVTTINGFLFIQTDKPLYTPEQEVQVRVYSFNEELRKSRRDVLLTFVDPKGIKVEMVEMTDVNGAKPLLPPFKIPLKPTYGIWKIVASYANTFKTTATAEFVVKEYVLPSISLQIDPEAKYISEQNLDSFNLKISAKYVYGRPVSSAYIFLMFGYSSPDSSPVMIPSTFSRHTLYNGKAEVEINIRQALESMPDGPQNLKAMKENTFLHVTVLLQEINGGISQEAVLSNVKFFESPYTLSLIATPPYIKPGLPYSMRILVKNPAGEPERGIAVKTTATVTTNDNEKEVLRFSGNQDEMTVNSRSDGLAYFTCNIPDNVKEAEFTFMTEGTSASQTPLKLKAESYVSTNKRYLFIDLPSSSSAFEVGQYIDVKIVFHYQDFLSLKTFNYQIISKGKVVSFDTVERVSAKTQSLNILITADMVPSARLLVYYVLHGEDRAELVADSTWIDVTAKCVKNLNVDVSIVDPKIFYKPNDQLKLKVTTKSNEQPLVAFSAVDTALYNLKSNDKDPLRKILQHVEKSDLGCGSGGGKNNADVFDRAGLMFITNANAQTSTGAVCTDKVRPKRSPQQIFRPKEAASKYCLAGRQSSPMLETCADRAERLPFNSKVPPFIKKMCKDAFLKCCEETLKHRKENTDKIILSREELMQEEMSGQSQIRSHFPESWLWEEHISKLGSVSITKTLPHSLTTWELKAVGVFNEGICMSDEKVRVFKDISVDVPLPYSMVRGEQIELRGSVYNQRSSKTWFSVTLTASDGVCVFRGAEQGKQGKANQNRGEIEGHSVAMVSFYIMALEAGTHKLTFDLATAWDSDTVIKKLKVVPEGDRKEILEGKRIDPNGVFGTSVHKVEIKKIFPPNVVPKSPVNRILTVHGEVLGELLSILNNPEGLKQLTNLPHGNAEMELMRLLPVYYVYHYLEKTEKWGTLGKDSAASENELKRKMQAGVTSMMSFRMKNGESFSMWSITGNNPSTWVTALIIKTFSDVHEYVSVDTDVVTNTIYWLIKNCQNNDGSFVEISKNNPHKLMGAGADVTENTIYLTSFVMIGIKNALNIPKVNIQAFKDALDRALQYLSAKKDDIKSLYVRAITSYALTLTDRHSVAAVHLYEKLKKKSLDKGDPVTVRFWEATKSDNDPLKPNAVSSETVETTVYILLNALVRAETDYAKPILNWLTQDQRYGGGFFTTQGSILTLEALTKYSILASKATLNMVVDIEYKTKAESISRIQLNQQKPVAKAIDVTKNDDVIVRTAMTTGVSFVKMRTVYYQMTETNENCPFETLIDIHERVPDSDDPMLLSQRIVACAKYKPPENTFETESGLTVMEIHLPTGVIPVQDDLDMYQNGLESRISNYEITGDTVFLQIDAIPSSELYCVGFRIQEEFETGMTRASVFKVYEFSAPDNQCMKFYNKQSRKLLRLCEGDQCQCMAAECCNFKSSIDPTITSAQRKKDTCQEDVKYVFKVLIESSEAVGDFVTYTAKAKAVLKKEKTDDIKIDSEIEFVKKATCTSTEFEVNKHYLIKAAESIKIQVHKAYKYKFPLDSSAWVDWWPAASDCNDDACKQHASVLDEFESNFKIFGCGEEDEW